MREYADAWLDYVSNHEDGSQSVFIMREAAKLTKQVLCDSITTTVGVLELGCGTGSYLHALLAEGIKITKYVGVDAEPRLTAYAAAHAPTDESWNFQVLDLRQPHNLPTEWSEGVGTTVIALIRVLNYLNAEEAAGVLQRIRTSFPDSHVIIVVPNEKATLPRLDSCDAVELLGAVPKTVEFSGACSIQFPRSPEAYATAMAVIGFPNITHGGLIARHNTKYVTHIFSISIAS